MPKCEECGREFSTEAALAQHLKDKHGIVSSQPEPKGKGGGEPPKTTRKQKSLRKRNRHPVALSLAAVAVAAGVGFYFVFGSALAGPPFGCSTGETWIHMHPYLTIQIGGKNVTIPADVGVVEGGTCNQPVHTHDASGLLHIELSQTDAKSHNYTLGDFFTIWSYTARSTSGTGPTLNGASLPVEFSSTDVLGFRANSTYQVVLLVDGKPSTQWGSLNLEQLDYCSGSNSGSPCCPTDCASAGGPASNPYWKGTTNYPYGYGHTIVIEYVKA